MKIVTHPGQAHRDEFIACCLLLAKEDIDSIERREPTPEELADPNVFVVDIGEVYDSKLNSFDHHQFDRDAPPTCSIELVAAKYVAIADWAVLVEAWPWLELSSVLDSKGPYEAAKYLNCPAEVFFKTSSPIETAMLSKFQSAAEITWSDDHEAFRLMREIGQRLWSTFDQLKERLVQLEASEVLWAYTPDGRSICILDARCISSKDSPSFGIETFIKRRGETVDVVLTYDDRGPGLSLFRRECAKEFVDFSLIEQHKDVLFTHKNGFIAKTKSPDCNPVDLVNQAAH